MTPIAQYLAAGLVVDAILASFVLVGAALYCQAAKQVARYRAHHAPRPITTEERRAAAVADAAVLEEVAREFAEHSR